MKQLYNYLIESKVSGVRHYMSREEIVEFLKSKSLYDITWDETKNKNPKKCDVFLLKSTTGSLNLLNLMTGGIDTLSKFGRVEFIKNNHYVFFPIDNEEKLINCHLTHKTSGKNISTKIQEIVSAFIFNKIIENKNIIFDTNPEQLKVFLDSDDTQKKLNDFANISIDKDTDFSWYVSWYNQAIQFVNTLIQKPLNGNYECIHESQLKNYLKNLPTKKQKDPVDPSDVYLIKKGFNKFSINKDEYVSTMNTLYNEKEIIGISLKKIINQKFDKAEIIEGITCGEVDKDSINIVETRTHDGNFSITFTRIGDSKRNLKINVRSSGGDSYRVDLNGDVKDNARIGDIPVEVWRTSIRDYCNDQKILRNIKWDGVIKSNKKSDWVEAFRELSDHCQTDEFAKLLEMWYQHAHKRNGVNHWKIG